MDAAAYGEPETRSAAETLRSVEALRKRGAAMTRPRAFPLWVWAGAFLAALPLAASGRDVYETLRIEDGSAVVTGSVGDHPKMTLIAVAVAAVLAAIVSIIDHRRQPVHRARERRQISIGEGIIIAAVLFILGPGFLAALIMVAVTNAVAFVGATVLALLVGAYIRNRTLAVAAVVGLFGVIVGRFASPDHWPAIACGVYILAFSIGGLTLTQTRRAAS